MADKAASVVEGFCRREVGDDAVLHGAVHQPAAKAAGTAGLALFFIQAFAGVCAVSPDRKALANAVDRHVVNVAAQHIQCVDTPQFEQRADHVHGAALGVGAAYFGHAGHIGHAEEATGVQASLHAAQTVDRYAIRCFCLLFLRGSCIRFFADGGRLDESGKTARIRGVFDCVILLVGAIHHKAPGFIRRRNAGFMDGSVGGGQQLNQVSGIREQTVQNFLEKTAGGVGVDAGQGRRRGNAHITADGIPSSDPAQILHIAAGGGCRIFVAALPDHGIFAHVGQVVVVELDLCPVSRADKATGIAHVIPRSGCSRGFHRQAGTISLHRGITYSGDKNLRHLNQLVNLQI